MGQRNVTGYQRKRRKKGGGGGKRFDADEDASFVLFKDKIYDIEALWKIAYKIPFEVIDLARLDLSWVTAELVRTNMDLEVLMFCPILVVPTRVQGNPCYHVLVGKKQVLKTIILDLEAEMFVKILDEGKLGPAERSIKEYTPRKK